MTGEWVVACLAEHEANSADEARDEDEIIDDAGDGIGLGWFTGVDATAAAAV